MSKLVIGVLYSNTSGNLKFKLVYKTIEKMIDFHEQIIILFKIQKI